ncbi:MAG: DUF6062 family protein [Acutalibacteraceae bacterium]|nr:DUF6062 family protein [Acutalibacteraceae bacterium]
MRDDICTIPVSEVFEEQCGCPICRMYHTVEEHIITYILGDAMMEPDVRIETNKVGFCAEHLDKMMHHRGRLQLALMLETHIKSVEDEIFGKKLFNGNDKKAQRAQKLSESCFICNKMEWGINHMFDTIYRCYERERDFRDMFNAQPQFCLVHFERLMMGATKQNMPKYHKEFKDNLTRITGEYARSLCSDVSAYCKKYDYRSREDNSDWGSAATSVERTVAFLSGEIYED